MTILVKFPEPITATTGLVGALLCPGWAARSFVTRCIGGGWFGYSKTAPSTDESLRIASYAAAASACGSERLISGLTFSSPSDIAPSTAAKLRPSVQRTYGSG